jgi:hypothetical protein
MKRSDLSVQCDLFSSVPTLPALATLELHHDELVELLSRLLWEVAQSSDETMTQGSHDDQDQS